MTNDFFPITLLITILVSLVLILFLFILSQIIKRKSSKSYIIIFPVSIVMYYLHLLYGLYTGDKRVIIFGILSSIMIAILIFLVINFKKIFTKKLKAD
jgi:hypothetical protein